VLGLLFLGIIALWLACGVLVGHWVYRKKGSRWLQLAATLFALWLPLWDAIPGYLLYQKAIRAIGGVRIHQTVYAEGYLDHTAVLGHCWRELPSTPYAYCENVEADSAYSSLGPLNAKAGYYEYRLAPIDAPECAPFREHLNVEYMQRQYQLGPRCVVATRRDEPFSRFEYSHGSEFLPSPWPVPPVLARWDRVRDLATGQTVAQATRLNYILWILRPIRNHPFQWNYKRDQSDQFISLIPQDVIQPAR
jgi:hypothetical protein